MSGFYQGQVQGQPVQQQQPQYPPAFQQPQNIYQQLGKPQPQPHLQRLPTYTVPLQQPQQQQPQQPIQSQGFQLNQQSQYAQGPQQAIQAPYTLSQSPYSVQQAPYQLSQTPYIPSQTPFTSPTPYPVSQTPYAPVQYTQQQHSNNQYPVQQQQQPLYSSSAPTQISQVLPSPTSSFPNQTSSAIPLNSSGSSWRTPASRPPPVALSATLAQQARAPAPAQQPPQAVIPQAPGRRPLPQPSPGANAKTPMLPPASTPQRMSTLPNLNSNLSGSVKPFPVQPIQTNIPQGSKTPSPTRNRPLPTPTETGSKRNTVDLGKLDHSVFNSGLSHNSVVNAGPSAASSSSSWATKREVQPTKSSPPTLEEMKALNNSRLSRTSSYAVTLNSGPDAPGVPKRRASPPRFQSQPNSESNSPTKESPLWTKNNSASRSTNSSTNSASNQPPRILTGNAPPMSSSPTKSSSSSVSDVSLVSSPSSAAAAPRKFIPMWKRTIPEMPAPAWGYAAGMVAEPHPKPQPLVQAAPAPVLPIVPPAKGKGKLKKKLGGPLSPPAPVPVVPPANPMGCHSQYQQNNGQGLNSGYPRANDVQQKYPAYQQQFAQYATPRGASPQHVQQQQHYGEEEEETEEEETEEEETEEDEGEEEEDEEDEEETEESEPDNRYTRHGRQHSQLHANVVDARRRSQSQGRRVYEEEDEQATPKKKVLRPKAKVDPYTAYGASSPSSRIKPKVRREADESYSMSSPTKIKLRPKVRNTSDDEDRTPKKRITREAVEARKHQRSKSAFEEREVVRHRREPSERERPRPGSAFAGDPASRRRAKSRYTDDDEEEDDASIRLAYDDDEKEESEIERRKPLRKKVPARDVRGDRRQASSPQYGIRDMKPANRCVGSGSGSAGGTRYKSDYEEPEDEEDDHRQRVPTNTDARSGRGYRSGKERGYDQDSEPERHERRYRGAGTTSGTPSGLPQPPAMVREPGGGAQDRKIRGGPRLKSAPIKFDDYDDDLRVQDRQAYENLPTKISAMNTHGNGTRSESRGSIKSGPWPVDLPRLPRTPGSEMTPGSVTNDGGGYFDIKPQPISHSSSDFGGRLQGRGEISVNDDRIQRHRANLNLDDPPPRATAIRTPSPGPSGYTLSRELPRPQGPSQTQVHPPSAERVGEQLARRRSLYSVPSVPAHQTHETAKERRPQSQVYSVSNNQVHQMGRPPLSNSSQFSNNQLNQAFNNSRHQPQTPAPPPTVGIESPHPIGGRDKMTDIPKLEEDSNDGSDNEHRRMSRAHMDHSSSRSNRPKIHVDPPQSRPPSIPMINVNSSPMGVNIPMINIDMDDSSRPHEIPRVQVFEIPGVSVSAPGFDDHHGGPSINISGPNDQHQHGHEHHHQHAHQNQHQQQRPQPQARSQTGDFGRQSRSGTGGLICGGCNGPIIGRIVSAMGSRYHPGCFKCAVCGELLEHVSSYEHEGRPYCHLDYHENFAPKCYSCKTSIIEEQFISLDDPALGKRAYHTQHFFCAECGDPFLTPSGGLPSESKGELALSGDGEFEGFTVYKGHPYCEACHVRLRLPKCKRCKRSIRDNDEAVEALGGKWCWSCFVCASCNKPFENPSFFQRDDQPYCEHCFSIMLRNEI